MRETVALLDLGVLLLAAALTFVGGSRRWAWVLLVAAAAWLPANNGVAEGPVLLGVTGDHGLTLSDLLGIAGAVAAGLRLWPPDARAPGRWLVVRGGTVLAVLVVGFLLASFVTDVRVDERRSDERPGQARPGAVTKPAWTKASSERAVPVPRRGGPRRHSPSPAWPEHGAAVVDGNSPASCRTPRSMGGRQCQTA